MQNNIGDCKSIEVKATNLCTSSSCFPDLHPTQPRRQITCTLLILQYLYLYFVFLSPRRPTHQHTCTILQSNTMKRTQSWSCSAVHMFFFCICILYLYLYLQPACPKCHNTLQWKSAPCKVHCPDLALSVFSSYLYFGCICIFCILNRPTHPRRQNIYIQMHYSHLTISVIYFYFFLSFIMCVFVFVFISIFVFLSITFFQDRQP